MGSGVQGQALRPGTLSVGAWEHSSPREHTHTHTTTRHTHTTMMTGLPRGVRQRWMMTNKNKHMSERRHENNLLQILTATLACDLNPLCKLRFWIVCWCCSLLPSPTCYHTHNKGTRPPNPTPHGHEMDVSSA